MKKTLSAWFIFFGGFMLEIFIDHLLRIQDQNISTGGIPELIWFLIQIMLAILALWLAFVATKPLVALWKRLLVLGLQASIGFIIYVFIGLNYIVGTGIDSL